MNKKGILLAGCGFLDEFELHEALPTLLAINRADTEALSSTPEPK
ncbi:MAG: hypothetical protein WBP54_00415 [Pelodictyon phaeoclathratiforme]